ncbi:ribbon-helix-helix domain-containing protein [Candidatus Altiarchaeota archaeon]
MTKICVEIPKEILDDLREHVGEDRKFVNLSDAIRTACRKLLDRLDDIDERHNRGVRKRGK